MKELSASNKVTSYQRHLPISWSQAPIKQVQLSRGEHKQASCTNCFNRPVKVQKGNKAREKEFNLLYLYGFEGELKSGVMLVGMLVIKLIHIWGRISFSLIG